jgi:hypothetical protein
MDAIMAQSGGMSVNRDFSNITRSSHVFEELSRFVLESENRLVGTDDIPFIRKNTRLTLTVAMCLASGVWVNVSHVEWRLLYRASEHNYNATQFHLQCDNKGATLTLVKATNGRFAAGYAGVSWDRLRDGMPSNPTGFIAQITSDVGQENSLVKFSARHGSTILSMDRHGPSFSNGFVISDKCNNNENSYSDPYGIFFNENGGTSMDLLGSVDFRVDEYEVFQIVLQ